MILLTLIMKLINKFPNLLLCMYYLPNSFHIIVQCNYFSETIKLAIVVRPKEIMQIYMLGPQFVKIQDRLQ